jgi:hypothetical protein
VKLDVQGKMIMLTDTPKETLSERPLDKELERPLDKELERGSDTYQEMF